MYVSCHGLAGTENYKASNRLVKVNSLLLQLRVSPKTASIRWVWYDRSVKYASYEKWITDNYSVNSSIMSTWGG